MSNKSRGESLDNRSVEKKHYKYLYEIKQTNPKPGEAVYYRGSRKSKLPPEQDFWIKYFTSSKLVAKKIEEEGIGAFEIVEIKPMPEDCHILYEEHLYLIEVDAKNNPLYFNQHNNDGYNHLETGRRVCPHCYHKNYGHPFENCSNCGKCMQENRCLKCGEKLDNPSTRCSCGYSRTDDTKYTCLKCGMQLNHPMERCSCGYSRNDDVEYTCRQCGNKLKYSFARCLCGYSVADEVQYHCLKCGKQLTSYNKRCSCGYCTLDEVKYNCAKCGNKLNYSMERCACGYSRNDDINYRCLKCDAELKSQNERCVCGYSKNHDANYHCLKCGNPLNHQYERCSCGYARADDIEHSCIKCGRQLTSYNKRCSCGYSRVDDVTCNCPKCGNSLTNVFARCSCGYCRVDEIEYLCKKCGAQLTTSASRCPQCKIRYGGFSNWRDRNPIYRLMINHAVVFEGYKHLCIDFMVNERICSKETGNNLIKGKIKVFKPRQRLKQYPNNFNYAGLRAEFISYPE